MELLSALVRGLPEYPRLLEAAKAGQTTSVYGASPVHRAHLTAALLSDLPQRTFCVVLRDEQAAKTFAADFYAFGSPLTETITLYAIWQSETTGKYTVILWKQKVTGGTAKTDYDLGEVITQVSGTDLSSTRRSVISRTISRAWAWS